MRIGEILVAQNKLRATELARALAEQQHTGKRLCSMLVSRGLLDFDDASRALSAQRGVPCALKNHLDHRDRSLESAIPAALARSMVALPIARTRSGQLIIVVRDPGPQAEAALAQTVREKFVMIIAPAQRVEELVAEVYGGIPDDELDVDMTSGPIPVMDEPQPPRPDMQLLDPDSIQLALTSLDDDRVTKDPSQSGHSMPAFGTRTTPTTNPGVTPMPAFGTRTTPTTNPGVTPMPAAPPRVEPAPPAPPPQPPTVPPRGSSAGLAVLPPTFDQLARLLGQATNRDAATDHVLAYMKGRWVAGVVLALRGTTAVGYRGFGDRLPALASISVPIGPQSIVQRAIESQLTAVARPASPVQQQIENMLGLPDFPAATPILVGGHVVAVIAVGDPARGAEDFEDATADLSLVAEALSGAYERIHGRR